MGQYNKAIITAAGENLIAKAVAGKLKLNITKAKISDHKYPDGTDYKALTDMDGVKQVLDSPETKVLDNNMIQTRVLFSNEEIQVAYYIQNIGLYAKDGEEEILFCIVTAETPDEMPKYNGVASTSYIYNIQSLVQDAAEINIEVVSSGTATIQDVQERVEACGGDISETIIENLESIDTKYPVPAVGESTKAFMGKIKKYIEDTKPIDENMSVKVSSLGEDIPGGYNGTKLYKTIQYAINTIPKNLNGNTAFVELFAGTYDEDVIINGFTNGKILLQYGPVPGASISTDCSVRSVAVSYCDSVFIHRLNLTTTSIGVTSERCNYVDITYCQQNTAYTGSEAPTFSFKNVSYGRLYGNKSTNHDMCIYAHTSTILSEQWVDGSSSTYGIGLAFGGNVLYGYGSQPSGPVTRYNKGTVTVNSYGAEIGTATSSISVYVSNTGNDFTGTGQSSKPFKTIQHAIDSLPKDLNGYDATISLIDGTYPEDLIVKGFKSGTITIRRNGSVSAINYLCNVSSITVNDCDSVEVLGIRFTKYSGDCVVFSNCYTVNVSACVTQGGGGYKAYKFEDVANGKITKCLSTTFDTCLALVRSKVFSDEWDSQTLGITYGYTLSEGAVIVKGSGFQPKGNTYNEFVYRTAGVIVNEFGARVGTLPYDITLYVSKSGSDIIGDGSSGNPFLTIQHAINIIPKDLGSFNCTINVVSGTYNEDVSIRGFHNGSLNLYSDTMGTLSTSCSILSVLIGHCTGYVRVNGFNMISATKVPITVFSTDGAYIYYCQCTLPTSSINGINCYESRVSVEYCKMTGKDTALMASFSTVISNNWYSSGGNNYGIYSLNGSRIITNGSQPSGINENSIIGNGGMYINNNGTQISNIISSGLSCTWGTIRGGYIRYGNPTGPAMITIQVNIITTIQLTAGIAYEVTGFPLSASPYDIAVATNRPSILEHTHFRASLGRLSISPTTNFATNNSIILNCTYLTNTGS